MFNYNNEVLTRYNGEDEVIIIPKKNKGVNITVLGSRAFYHNKSIKKVFIPNTVKTILDLCFDRCTNLEEVIFEEGSQISLIDRAAFRNCYNLKKFSINSTEELIIKENVFYDCSLKYLDLSNTKMRVIHDNAFYLSKLEEIIFPKAGIDEIGVGSFMWSQIKPNVFNSLHIKEIPEDAFCCCCNITEIPKEWLDTIEHIQENAFHGCSITSLNLPAKNIYFEECFSNNVELKEVVFESNVEPFTIPRKMFCECDNLEKVILPNNIESINREAFSECNISEINFPKNLNHIASCAFEINNLKKVDLSDTKIDFIGPYAFYSNEIEFINLNPYAFCNIGVGCFGDNTINKADQITTFYYLDDEIFKKR